MVPLQSWIAKYVYVSLCMSACVYVSVLVWTLTDYDCISIGFSPSEKWCRAQTEKWDQRGKLISLSQTHSSPECGHTERETHTVNGVLYYLEY